MGRTEIRIFAYFRNLVLISCFLGLGIGFSLKRFSSGILTAIVLVALLAVAIHPEAQFHGVSLRKVPEYLVFSDFQMWYTSGGASALKFVAGFAMISGVMILLAGVFVPFGQILGKIFSASDNRIRDYSINLAGSLLGTWTFALLSYLTMPPWIWLLAGLGGAVALIGRDGRRIMAGMAILVLVLLLAIPREKSGAQVFWSPYQKLTLSPGSRDYDGTKIGYLSLDVNSVLYMYIFTLSHEMASEIPGPF